MKHLNRLAALLGVLFMLLLFAGRSNAQFPGRAPAMNPSGMMRDMKFGPLALLARSKVQKELKLNKSQNEAVKKLQKEQATIFSEKTKGGRGGDTAQMMETIKQVQAAHVEPGTRAKAVRTDEQRQRLGEIRLQAMGLEAFQDPEAQTALGMTPDQKTNLSALNTKPSMWNAGSYKKKLEAREKEFQEKAAKTLTADQTALLKKMQGEPFKDIKAIKGS